VATVNFANAVAETIITSPKIESEGIQASYIRAVAGVIGFVAAAILFIFGLARVGVALAPLLTGVGIGGLAVALAARPTLENIGQRPNIRRLFNINVTYDTPPVKINRAVDIIREIMALPEGDESVNAMNEKGQLHPNMAINQPDFPPRVYFKEFGSDSLEIMVLYWYYPPSWWDYIEHAHRLNTQIIDRFNAEGINFAFPTQTIHLSDDIKKYIKPDENNDI
jgi:MscS family membrane protein